eukprot:531446-Rhodomonas_salina.1
MTVLTVVTIERLSLHHLFPVQHGHRLGRPGSWQFFITARLVNTHWHKEGIQTNEHDSYIQQSVHVHSSG